MIFKKIRLITFYKWMKLVLFNWVEIKILNSLKFYQIQLKFKKIEIPNARPHAMGFNDVTGNYIEEEKSKNHSGVNSLPFGGKFD